MQDVLSEIRNFKRARRRQEQHAGQAAAFFLACGIDLSAALAAERSERERIIVRLERLIERERLRGGRRHWAYDLNRHVALKQALDRLVELRDGTAPETTKGGTRPPLGIPAGRKRR